MLSLLSLGMLFSFKHQWNSIHTDQVFFLEIFKAVFWVSIGAILTYSLIQRFHLSAVISSAIVGLVASFLPLLNPKWTYSTQLPTLMYCGSFVGMTSPVIANGVPFIICSGAIAGILFVAARKMFHGFGGKLGALALWAVMITYMLFIFFY